MWYTCRRQKRTILICLVVVQSFIFFNILFVPTQIWMPLKRQSSNSSDFYAQFLANYTDYCEMFLLPKAANLLGLKLPAEKRLCKCVPDTLLGNIDVASESVPPVGEIELDHVELLAGGQWFPTTCIPRQRVAIIVPYRDRELHLAAFLSVIHPFLQRQMLHYTIFVVEQVAPIVFNKASLMNVGFLEARLFADFDCYIFHDVDLLPENDHNFYTCSAVPRHVGSHIDKYEYRVYYPHLVGGAVALHAEHFVLINGYSNQYYGWGGEDDDLYYRMEAKNVTFIRFPEFISRYSMIKHKEDSGNPANSLRRRTLYNTSRKAVYLHDGVNSVRYMLKKVEARPLYVWLAIELPRHPSHIDREFWLGWIWVESSDSYSALRYLRLSLALPFVLMICLSTSF